MSAANEARQLDWQICRLRYVESHGSTVCQCVLVQAFHDTDLWLILLQVEAQAKVHVPFANHQVPIE
jgi:hypothetical protein